MKRYKKYISQTMAALLLGAVAAGCSDDLGFEGNGIVEGEPVTLSVNCAVGDMPEVSRADMAAGRDKEINSMWVAFFAKDGTHEKKYEFTYDNVSQVNTMDVHFPTLSGLNMTSGEYYLVAVANPAGNRGVTETSTTPSDLMGLLTNVNTLEEYKKIAVYTDPGTVGTPTGNLVMQGIYTDPRNHTVGASTDFWTAESEKTVKVPAGTKTLAGAIHFRRLISQVKFNITYDTQKFSSFEPVSATVYNVPSYSWLAERADNRASGNKETNAGDNIGDNPSNNYTASQRFYIFNQNANTYSIDWYQMENRRQSLEQNSISKYSDRENERKDNDLNTGIYIPLCGETGDTYIHNNNASYVVINARMTLRDPVTIDEDQQATRTVDATYTIHLGYCEGTNDAEKSNDYNCRRNTKYNYTVSVKDVNKIVVEAQKENVDYEHGAEGIITDITGRFFSADSHFEQYNVYFNQSDLNTFQWSVRVYISPREFITIDDRNYNNPQTYPDNKVHPEYYDWIGFISTTSSTRCASYDPDAVIKLSELKEKGTQGNYTMFINEYIYEETGDGTLTPSWKSYVNLPDRMAWLKVDEYRSTDGESVIVRSKYAVQQKSLQTYYGINPENPAQALALEHVEETADLNFSVDGTGSDSHGGRYQTAKELKVLDENGDITTEYDRPLWETYLNMNGFYGNTGVVSVRDAGLIRLCLNRNRDLNGDGQIDASEMRWFVPSLNQYVRFVMGSQSLSTPLYDYSDKTQGGDVSYYHYGSSEGWTLWAEEYMSTGRTDDDIAHVRCARYLGVDQAKFEQTPAEPAFKKRDGVNQIEFHYANESLRDKTISPLPWHYVNSPYNRPYKALEYTTTDINVNTNNPFTTTPATQMTINLWFGNVDVTNPCAGLNVNGQRGWRVPNQVEMTAIMFADGPSLRGARYLTVTREFFSQGRIMGTTGSIATAISNYYLIPGNAGGTVVVRCVRDVE